MRINQVIVTASELIAMDNWTNQYYCARLYPGGDLLYTEAIPLDNGDVLLSGNRWNRALSGWNTWNRRVGGDRRVVLTPRSDIVNIEEGNHENDNRISNRISDRPTDANRTNGERSADHAAAADGMSNAGDHAAADRIGRDAIPNADEPVDPNGNANAAADVGPVDPHADPGGRNDTERQINAALSMVKAARALGVEHAVMIAVVAHVYGKATQ